LVPSHHAPLSPHDTFILAVVWLVIQLRAFIVYNFRLVVAPHFCRHKYGAATDEVWHNAGRKQACPLSYKGVFRYFKLPKILQDYPSHRIFERIHRALNIGKK
jgi:hypothetical protein